MCAACSVVIMTFSLLEKRSGPDDDAVSLWFSTVLLCTHVLSMKVSRVFPLRCHEHYFGYGVSTLKDPLEYVVENRSYRFFCPMDLSLRCGMMPSLSLSMSLRPLHRECRWKGHCRSFSSSRLCHATNGLQ